MTVFDNQRAKSRAPWVQYSVMFEPVYYGIPAQAMRLIGVLVVGIILAVIAANWIYVNLFDNHEHKM